ncbi:hypothetical protein L596_028590 [Steinernema carpocapsae]|uniref:Uncharacterized protein n=1 Tax=Steinernema carpocapsae TaxID=34508 RepID=A0A4U5LYU9_STECR|nr:hypothetical protein L596_028590 [Steinernema carpocapsae]
MLRCIVYVSPADILQAWEELKNTLDPLIRPVAYADVYSRLMDRRPRTNNQVKEFHNALASFFGVSHPNIFKFVAVIKGYAEKTSFQQKSTTVLTIFLRSGEDGISIKFGDRRKKRNDLYDPNMKLRDAVSQPRDRNLPGAVGRRGPCYSDLEKMKAEKEELKRLSVVVVYSRPTTRSPVNGDIYRAGTAPRAKGVTRYLSRMLQPTCLRPSGFVCLGRVPLELSSCRQQTSQSPEHCFG